MSCDLWHDITLTRRFGAHPQPAGLWRCERREGNFAENGFFQVFRSESGRLASGACRTAFNVFESGPGDI